MHRSTSNQQDDLDEFLLIDGRRRYSNLDEVDDRAEADEAERIMGNALTWLASGLIVLIMLTAGHFVYKAGQYSAVAVCLQSIDKCRDISTIRRVKIETLVSSLTPPTHPLVEFRHIVGEPAMLACRRLIKYRAKWGGKDTEYRRCKRSFPESLFQ